MEIKYCRRCIFNKVYSFILTDKNCSLPMAPEERSMMAWTAGCGAIVFQDLIR